VTGRLPVTPVLNGKPVALVKVPLAGVPKTGAVNTGAVSVLFVSVVVLVAVTTLLGVMIPDSATVAMIDPYIVSKSGIFIFAMMIAVDVSLSIFI